MNHVNKTWCELAMDILAQPVDSHPTRPRRSIPGRLVTFTHTPLVSVRHTAWRNALREFEWLTSSNGELWKLHGKAQHWWSRWAKNGIVPGITPLPIRDFARGLIEQPHSRRHVLTTWDGQKSPVPRNDFVIQATASSGMFDLFVFQRSCDLLRGANHNWIQYWAFGLWLSRVTRLDFDTLRWISGDIHLYDAHTSVVEKCLNATPGSTPRLGYNSYGSNFNANEFQLVGEYLPCVSDRVEYL